MTNKLIVGLGNPGKQYENNRHNIGFKVIDYLAHKMALPLSEKVKFKAEFASGSIRDKKIFLLKPLTYMNLSGQSVAAVANFYKISLDNILVIHDEIDLKFADIRFKQGGGNAGHNGLKSISACVGNEYGRIRIGVGRPQNSNIEIADYVLQDFNPEENTIIENFIPNSIFSKVTDFINN